MSYNYKMGPGRSADESSGIFDYSEEPWFGVEVSLTLLHADLDPDRITALLGAQPTRSAKPDSAHPDPVGSWSIDYRCPRNVDDELTGALSTIEQYAPQVNQLMSFGVEAYITVFAIVRDGCTLRISNELLEKLTSMGIPVFLIPNANDR